MGGDRWDLRAALNERYPQNQVLDQHDDFMDIRFEEDE